MAQQRVLEASDIVPGDDLIAIGKKVAKRRDGEQYLEFAMTLEELFKLGINGYTTVQDEGISLPARAIMNFVGAGVTVTDAGGKTIVTIPTPTVSLVEDITYAALAVKVGASTLEPGKEYNITDFATTHIIPNTGGVVNVGSVEPLIVMATSVNKLDTVAKSVAYPKDIIHYEFVDSTTAGGDKGRIYFRKDPVKNISTQYDWRNVKFRRWANHFIYGVTTNLFSAGDIGKKVQGSISGAIGYVTARSNFSLSVITESGVFQVAEQIFLVSNPLITENINSITTTLGYYSLTDNGLAFQDRYTFENSNDPASTYNAIIEDAGQSVSSKLNNIVFTNDTNNVYFGYGCYDTHITSGNSVYFANDAYSNFFYSIGRLRCEGVFFNNKFYGGTNTDISVGRGNMFNNVFGTNIIEIIILQQFTGNTIGNDMRKCQFRKNFTNNTVLDNFYGNTSESDINAVNFANQANLVYSGVDGKTLIKDNAGNLFLSYIVAGVYTFIDPTI